jgi:hypothetical protein
VISLVGALELELDVVSMPFKGRRRRAAAQPLPTHVLDIARQRARVPRRCRVNQSAAPRWLAEHPCEPAAGGLG